MEKLLARVLTIFAIGFAITGLVVAGYDTGCGSLLQSSSCGERNNPGQVMAVLILVGLAITSGVAAYEARGTIPRPPEAPPTTYPGGAQV